MKNEERGAVVLLSGGLDSYTAAAMLKAGGFRLYALSIRYGQRHVRELESARRVAASLGAKAHLAIDSSIPVTYVPARNTVFLSLALAWAEALGLFDIGIGANALDYSGYPDCRPEYLRAFESMANLATKAGVEGGRFHIHAPLLAMTKADIVRKGLELGLDYGLTHSCYDPLPDGRPCGRCDSCVLRAKGFAEAGLQDPVVA